MNLLFISTLTILSFIAITLCAKVQTLTEQVRDLNIEIHEIQMAIDDLEDE